MTKKTQKKIAIVLAIILICYFAGYAIGSTIAHFTK